MHVPAGDGMCELITTHYMYPINYIGKSKGHNFHKSLRRLDRHLWLLSRGFTSRGGRSLLLLLTSSGIEHGLELRGRVETGVIRVSLVVVSVGLRVHLSRKLFHDAGDDVLDRVLLGGVAVPDGNEMRVEAD